MSSGRAFSANKRKAYAFWGIIVIGGLIPAAAHAASRPTQDAVSPAKFLSQSDASSAILNLNITIIDNGGARRAVLTGLYPPACAGKVSVASTATDSSLRDATGVEGFAVHDNGGFLSCVQKQKSKGVSCDNTAVVCNSLSQVAQIGQADPSINLPSDQTISLAYLNKTNNDAAVGDNWIAQDFGKDRLVSYSAQYIADQKEKAAEDAKAKHDAALQAAILKCAETRDGINDARDSLASSGLDQATIDDLTSKINEYQKRFDAQDLQSLQRQVNLAIQNGKTDQFDDLESQIYDFYNAHPDSGNKLAQLIYNMAEARASADGATEADLSKAADMINRAMDQDTGLNLSEQNMKTFEDVVRPVTGKLAQARIGLAYQACDEDTYNLQFQEQTAGQSEMSNPYGTMNALNSSMRSTQSACEHANKLYDQDLKSIQKQSRAAHCSLASSSAVPMTLFGNSSASSDSHGPSAQCQQLNDAQQGMQTTIQQVTANVQQEAQQQIQNYSQEQQMLANMMHPQQQASPMIPGNTMFAGSPGSPMFSNPFGGGMTYGGSMIGGSMIGGSMMGGAGGMAPGTTFTVPLNGQGMGSGPYAGSRLYSGYYTSSNSCPAGMYPSPGGCGIP